MPSVGQDNDQAASPWLLPGFEYRRIDVEGVAIRCAVKGSGPPLLLLHGYPENHLTWRHVAPALAEDHTVVLADLRGYGDSGKPSPDTAGVVYSKRSMADDQMGLMRQLGFGQFQLASHDRGAASHTGWSSTTPAPSPGSPSWTSCRPGTSLST